MIQRHPLLRRNVTVHAFLPFVVSSHARLDALRQITLRNFDFFRKLFSRDPQTLPTHRVPGSHRRHESRFISHNSPFAYAQGKRITSHWSPVTSHHSALQLRREKLDQVPTSARISPLVVVPRQYLRAVRANNAC